MSFKPFRSSMLIGLCAFMVAGLVHANGNQVRVVSEADLGQWWVPPPGHPNSAPDVSALMEAGQFNQGCLAVAFEIHADGSVSNERIWLSALANNDAEALKQTVLRGVHKWRFVPAPGNTGHDTVYTYQVLTYTMTMIANSMALDIPARTTKADERRANEQDKELHAKCEMTDFPQQVQAMIDSAQTGKKP